MPNVLGSIALTILKKISMQIFLSIFLFHEKIFLLSLRKRKLQKRINYVDTAQISRRKGRF